MLMLHHVDRLQLPTGKELIPSAQLLNTDPRDQANHVDILPYKDLLQLFGILQSIFEHKIGRHKSHNFRYNHRNFCSGLIYKILVWDNTKHYQRHRSKVCHCRLSNQFLQIYTTLHTCSIHIFCNHQGIFLLQKELAV